MQIFIPFFFLGSDKFFLNITSDQVTLELVAPDSKTCDYWQDAYHFLTNIKPTSGQMKENKNHNTTLIRRRFLLTKIKVFELFFETPLTRSPKPTLFLS